MRAPGGGSAEAMVKARPSGPVRRVAAVTVAVVAVIAGAGALSTWRYEAALSQAAVALSERGGAKTTAGLSAAFWHENLDMGMYLFEPLPAVLGDVTTQQDKFRLLVSELGAPSPAAERRSLAQAVAAQARYSSTFTQLRGVAGTGLARQFAGGQSCGGVAA